MVYFYGIFVFCLLTYWHSACIIYLSILNVTINLHIALGPKSINHCADSQYKECDRIMCDQCESLSHICGRNISVFYSMLIKWCVLLSLCESVKKIKIPYLHFENIYIKNVHYQYITHYYTYYYIDYC